MMLDQSLFIASGCTVPTSHPVHLYMGSAVSQGLIIGCISVNGLPINVVIGGLT